MFVAYRIRLADRPGHRFHVSVSIPAPGSRGKITPLEDATAIFARYQEARHITRLYVNESDVERARGVLDAG